MESWYIGGGDHSMDNQDGEVEEEEPAGTRKPPKTDMRIKDRHTQHQIAGELAHGESALLETRLEIPKGIDKTNRAKAHRRGREQPGSACMTGSRSEDAGGAVRVRRRDSLPPPGAGRRLTG